MGLVSIVLSTILVLLWLHFLWSRRAFYKVAYKLRGPIGLPFIGMALNMLHPDKYIQFMERTAKNYKSPFISWLGPKCFLYVADPETVEHVFNSPQCVNKGEFYRFVSSAIGDGLFTSSVPRWNHHRRLINPAFNRSILNSFITIFDLEANTLIEKLQTEKCVEMFELLKRSVLETACQTTMGQKMNFQNNGSAAIFESYNRLTETCIKRMLSPWLYPDIIFKRSSLYKSQKAVVSVLFEFIEGLLRFGIKSDFDVQLNESLPPPTSPAVTVAQENHIKNGNDLKDCYVDCTSTSISISKSKGIFVEQIRNHVDQGQLTWSDVRDEANVIIAASFETTSTALYFVCLCLAIYPEYQDTLYNELIDLFPLDYNIDSQHITKELIDRMKYTEMVINEAIRLFSPVPMVLRQVTDNELKLPNGEILPVGTQIGIDIFNMQRNELVWGSYAKQFRPELHFGDENVEKRHPFAFVPFTKGLRMCLGSRYAMMLMKVFIAKIFRNFRLSTNAKLEDLIIKGTISLKLNEYPKFLITKR